MLNSASVRKRVSESGGPQMTGQISFSLFTEDELLLNPISKFWARADESGLLEFFAILDRKE